MVLHHGSVQCVDKLEIRTRDTFLDFGIGFYRDGKITFEIHFEEGVLSEVSPEPRARMTRAAKATSEINRPVSLAKNWW